MRDQPQQSNTLAILSWAAIIIVIAAVAAYFGIWVFVPREPADELLIAAGQPRGAPERHLIPEDYQGWLTVRYGVPGQPELEDDAGVLVFRYSDSGVLETSTAWSAGVKHKEYFYVGDHGSEPLARGGLQGRIWGERDIKIGDEQAGDRIEHSSACFVGTRAQYGQAPPLHPDVLSDLTLPQSSN